MSISANWPWMFCLVVRFVLVFLVIFSLSQAIASGYDLVQVGKRRFRDHLFVKQTNNDQSINESTQSSESANETNPDDQPATDVGEQPTQPTTASPSQPKKKSRSKKRRVKSDSSKCVSQIDQHIKTTSKPVDYSNQRIEQETSKQSPSKSNKSSKSSLLAALAALEQVDSLIDDEIESRVDADSDEWCTVTKTSKVKSKAANKSAKAANEQSTRSHKRSSRVTLSKVTRDSDGVKSASLFVLTTRTKQSVSPNDTPSISPPSNPPSYSAATSELSAVIRSPSPIDSEVASCSTSDVWSDILSEVSMNEETIDLVSQSTEGEQIEGYSEITGRMEGQPLVSQQSLIPQQLSRTHSPLLDQAITQSSSKFNHSLNVRSFNFSQYHSSPMSVTETKVQETQSLQSQSFDRPLSTLIPARSYASPLRKGPPGFPSKPPAVHPLFASFKSGSQSLFSRSQPTASELLAQASAEPLFQPSTPTSRASQLFKTGSLPAQNSPSYASPRAAPIVEPTRLSMSADDYSDYENLIDQVLASPSDEDDDAYLSSLSSVPSQPALSLHSWSMSSQRLDASLSQPFSVFEPSFLQRPAQTAIIDDSFSNGWPKRRVENAQVSLPLKEPNSPKRSWRAPPVTRW